MEKGILLNDEGLKVTVIIENDNISFEFDKNYEFLSNLLKVEKEDNLTFVYLGMKKILRIQNDNIERIVPVKGLDIKILKALYESNKKMNSRNMQDYFLSVKDNISSYTYKSRTTTRTFGIIPKVRTETHTYLTQILDSTELIRFLNEYDVRYPMNEYGALDFNSDKSYSYDEIEYYGWSNNLERAFKVNLAHSSSIDRFDEAVLNREKILKVACASLEELLGESVEWKKIETDIKEASDDIVGQIKSLEEITQNKSKQEKKKFNREKVKLNEKLNKLNKLKSSQSAKILYNELLNISLDKLTNNHIDYSTVSFSNDSRLEFMSMKHKFDPRFNFMFTIDQNKAVKKFEDYSESLENLLNMGIVIGCEITGFEESFDGLKEKLEWVLPVLHIHPNSYIRIKASSFSDHTDSILEALKTIKEVSIKINEACSDLFGTEWGILPPPMIRIAHGLRLEGKQELIKLIKEFDAVIEYSLSANKALRNIKDYSKLSLAFYDKNKIKYVFSNDGGGMFYYKENEFDEELETTKKEIKQIVKEQKKEKVEKPKEEKIEVKEEVTIKPVIEEHEEKIVEEPKVEPKEEKIEIKQEIVEEPHEETFEIKQEIEEEPIDLIEPHEDNKNSEDIEASVVDDEPLEDESFLEQTLFDIFAELKKDNKKFDNYEQALDEENEKFKYDGKVLSETEKVNDELLKIRSYMQLRELDIDKDYLERKISIINSYNENSNNSDYAKMYLFLLERELFPDLNTSFKSVEYLYQNKDKEKNGIEKELDRILNLVIEQYDNDSSDNSLI